MSELLAERRVPRGDQGTFISLLPSYLITAVKYCVATVAFNFGHRTKKISASSLYLANFGVQHSETSRYCLNSARRAVFT